MRLRAGRPIGALAAVGRCDGEESEQDWGLRAALCAGVVIWQIYELTTASVFAPGDTGYLNYLIAGVALFGLIASLLKMVVEA
jgi:hypothetical protein